MKDKYIYTIGRIIGNRENGKIVVETLDLDIYVLDRFALVRRLLNDVCLFCVPGDYDKKREIVRDVLP